MSVMEVKSGEGPYYYQEKVWGIVPESKRTRLLSIRMHDYRGSKTNRPSGNASSPLLRMMIIFYIMQEIRTGGSIRQHRSGRDVTGGLKREERQEGKKDVTSFSYEAQAIQAVT
jgi:hypothetical protein